MEERHCQVDWTRDKCKGNLPIWMYFKADDYRIAFGTKWNNIRVGEIVHYGKYVLERNP